MANRYALTTVHYHNTVSGKDETVHIGGLRDSTHQSVVQNPALFTTTPLTTSTIHPKLVQYLLVNPAGP
jgi:hypothetical protein